MSRFFVVLTQEVQRRPPVPSPGTPDRVRVISNTHVAQPPSAVAPESQPRGCATTNHPTPAPLALSRSTGRGGGAKDRHNGVADLVKSIHGVRRFSTTRHRNRRDQAAGRTRHRSRATVRRHGTVAPERGGAGICDQLRDAVREVIAVMQPTAVGAGFGGPIDCDRTDLQISPYRRMGRI